MSLTFGQNLSKSIGFANSSYKSFSSWFILILLGLIGMLGAVAVFIGSLLISIALFFDFIPEFQELLDSIFELFNFPVVDSLASIVNTINGIGIAFIVIGVIVALICSFFLNGTFVRAARGGEMTLSHPGKLFVEGLLYFIITLIYMIPYIIVRILVNLGPMDNAVYGILVGCIVPLLLLIVTLMFAFLGVTAYAKEGKFGAAFNLKKIGSIIGKFGCLRLFGHVILFGIIVSVIAMILVFIPVLGWIVLLLISPFITIVTGRFFGNITESVEEPVAVPAAEEQ